jgi:hypothetical protein
VDQKLLLDALLMTNNPFSSRNYSPHTAENCIEALPEFFARTTNYRLTA